MGVWVSVVMCVSMSLYVTVVISVLCGMLYLVTFPSTLQVSYRKTIVDLF